MNRIHFLPMDIWADISPKQTVLEVALEKGIYQESPCGGHGKCKKCRVLIDGQEVLACQTKADREMTVEIPKTAAHFQVLTEHLQQKKENTYQGKRLAAAVDLGTTTLVCYLLDMEEGICLEELGMRNPQFPYGFDVITRLQYAARGKADTLTKVIRRGVSELITRICRKALIEETALCRIALVGNPCMVQLFLGMPTENLTTPPFSPAITHALRLPAKDYLSVGSRAMLLLWPSLAGYVGSDTLACILTSEMEKEDAYTLLVDIGTNGEIALGNRCGITVCSTSAGPALEGADISCGMPAMAGAIDHIWLEGEKLCYSVLGKNNPDGICGSGLIDTVALLLKQGRLNQRGKILGDGEQGSSFVRIAEHVILTQEDIRAVQLAKGAIAAGIHMLIEDKGIKLQQIERVFLAGAFGSYIRPENACAVGLIPEELYPRIKIAGNAAGAGCILAALSDREFVRGEKLSGKIRTLELSSLPGFPRTFARQMYFTK